MQVLQYVDVRLSKMYILYGAKMCLFFFLICVVDSSPDVVDIRILCYLFVVCHSVQVNYIRISINISYICHV